MLFLRRRSLLRIGLLLILSLPAIFPLLHPGFFVSDDGEWMIIRLSAFFQTLRDGQFPVRFLARLNHGYGYPVANFLYPGFMYLGSLIHLLGFGFVNTTKIILGLSLIGSSVLTFYWLKYSFGKIPSLIGALIYLYLPYHLFDVYTRGSVGEVLALFAVPLLLWSVEKKSLVVSSFAYGFLIISHNTLALLFSPLLFIYILMRGRKLIWAYLLGLVLSTFFWLPALYERQYVVFDQVMISKWQQYFLRDFRLFGFTSIIILFLSVILIVRRRRKSTPLVILFLLVCLVALFFALPISSLFWQYFSLGRFIQFPWRFLSLTLSSLSYLTAWIIRSLSQKNTIGIALFIVFLLLATDVKGELLNVSFIYKDEAFYTTNDATTTVHDEYLPRWIKVSQTELFDKKVRLLGQGSIERLWVTSNNIRFSVSAKKDSIIQVSTIYYPGWQAKIDDVSVPIDFLNPEGLIQFRIPKGNHQVVLSFRETFIRKIANMLSLSALLLLMLIFFTQRIKKVKNA